MPSYLSRIVAVSMKYTALLFAVCTLLGGCKAQSCVRRFKPPPSDDCSTFTEGALDEIPCFVYTNGHGFPQILPLEFPQENTRTCYRTCHNSSNDPDPVTCEASLTGVHNQNIPLESSVPNTTQQILSSPNYNKGKDYRKSTICRYDVTCPEGMILAYSFTTHVLENRTDTCETTDKCVDYVQLTFPNSAEKVTSCGQEPDLNTLFADGYGALYAEFYANRHEQAAGFSMDVICYDPEFLPSRRRRQSAGSERCTRVSDAKRPTVDREAQLREAITSENTESRASIEADLQEGSGRQRLIINELESLSYTDGRLVITRSYGQRTVTVAHNINVLYVSSRFASSKTIRGGCSTLFPGYAELYIRGNQAYLHRLGINPEFKPTSDEVKVISLLNQAVSNALECTYFFDVYDELDALEEKVDFQPSVCEDTFVEDASLSELARQYGNACNSFLRSAACSYQAVILHQDCTTGELIATSDEPEPTTKQPPATTDSPAVADTTTTTERQISAASGSYTTKIYIILMFSYAVLVFVQRQ